MAHTLNTGISPYEIVFTRRFSDVSFDTGLKAIHEVEARARHLAARAADSVPLEGEVIFDQADDPWQEMQTAAEAYVWSGMRVGCFVAQALIKQEGPING